MISEIFLKGERIYLRGLKDDDVKGNYAYWLNDPEINLYNSHGRFPTTERMLLEYVGVANSSNSALVLAIIDIDTDLHIGNISLQRINWIDRNAEIAFLLGERKFWGKNVMYEAGMLILNHAFKSLNLHRIYCGTSTKNLGMQRLAEKLGMVQEGIRREAIFKHGEFTDIIEYGLLCK